MSILAKKESLLRIFGSILILFAVLFTLIIDMLSLESEFDRFFMMAAIVPLIIIVVCFKLEWSLIRNNAIQFTVLFLLYLSTIIIIHIYLTINLGYILRFLIILLSNIFLILSWHFSLSIYKKQKIIFVISGVINILLTTFFKLNSLIAQFGILTSFFPIFLAIGGISLIIIIELNMKKKGLLNYI